jgi:NAD(P)-dependent dehydrogenase (short-subunit alcohol dehydrogenase family)
MPSELLASRYPTAFITVVSAGLGRAFAEGLLAAGVRVWGTARDVARPAPFAGRDGFTAVALDLSDGDAAEAAYARASGEAGGFALIINHARYGVFADAARAVAGLWHRQIEDMLQATLRLARLGLRDLQARDSGSIVNVSSLAVEFPLPYMSGYNVAKAGLSAWSETIAYEVHGTGVSVIDFRPGDFRTDFNRVATRGPGADEPRFDRVWRRLGRNLDIAPPPERAVADLLRAIRRGRSGFVRTGSFFQTRFAPALARIAPWSWKLALHARYFDLR